MKMSKEEYTALEVEYDRLYKKRSRIHKMLTLLDKQMAEILEKINKA